MKRDWRLTLARAVVVCFILTICVTTLVAQTFKFKQVVIDDNYNDGAKPGWSRMADVDQDGYIDVIAGGGNYIGWYKNPCATKNVNWEESVIGAAGCNGGVLFDVDRDGDPDVVTSVGTEGYKVFWFENPNQRFPSNQNKENWTRRVIDASPGLTFQHDLEIADMDMDGVPDDFVVLFDNYKTKKGIIKWYRAPVNLDNQKWEVFNISSGQQGGVGLAVGDINADGRNDLVRGGKWYQGPSDVSGKWLEHTITDMHLTNVRICDLDNDGDLDIAAAAGWDDKGVVMWMENQDNGRSFSIHTIDTLYHPENMVIADLDGDGHFELITSEMKGATNSNFIIFENRNIHDDENWEKHVISENNGICARMNALDVDADGDMDIVCDGNAQNHICLWINETSVEKQTKVAFKYSNLDENYAPGWIRAGDMDSDKDIDIVAGGGWKLYIYENDGSEMNWIRHGSLDSTKQIGCNAAELYDVDQDGDLDIIAGKKDKEIGWWENPGNLTTSKFWNYHTSQPVERFYLHDMIKADMDGDGLAEEFIINLNRGYWNATVRLNWYNIGNEPKGLWQQNIIEPGRNEKSHGHAGLDYGDINGDGIMDIAYSSGWYEGGNVQESKWLWHEVSPIYGISNNLIRDIDGDGDMDLVISAGHHGQGVYWMENCKGNTVMPWKQHNIDALVHNPEGLQVADMDNDGDPDVIAAELFFGEGPGEPDWDEDVHNVYFYENLNGDGSMWHKVNIAPDSRPPHSLRLVDVNQDGKPDIIAESSGSAGVIYMENISK